MPGDELHTNKSLLRWHYPDQVTGQRSTCPYSQPACRQLPLCVIQLYGLYTGQIFTCSGIDLQLVACVDEQRNHDLCSGLDRCRFGGALCRIAGKSGLCLGHFEFHKERRLDREHIAIVGADLHDLVFLDKFKGISHLILRQCDLVKGLVVHKVVEFAVIIQIAHIHTLDPGLREFLGRPEGFLKNSSGDDVFVLGFES